MYATELSYADYFGDSAIGKYAVDFIKNAWKAEPKMFRIDKRQNLLIYSYPSEGGRYFELTRLKDELPPQLEAKATGKSLTMKYDIACEVFETNFRKGVLAR